MSGRSKNAARQSFSVDESIYLLAESATVPSNAGMVQIFDLPQGVGSEFVGELRRSLLSGTDLPAVLRRRGRDPVGTVGLFRWIEVDDIDLSQHIRLSSLSGAGTEADLFAHVAALHSVRLDRHRPLWEFHLIEGLAGARFAVYFKMHHALGDGATVLRLLAGSLIGAENASGLPLFGADLDRDPLPPTAPVRQRVGGMAAARRRRTAARRRRRRPELNALRFCAPRTPFSVSDRKSVV